MTTEQKKKYDELIAGGMSHEDALAAVGGDATAPKKSALDSAMDAIENGSGSGEVTSLMGRPKGSGPAVEMKGNGKGNTQVPGRDPAVVAAEEEERQRKLEAKKISPEEETKFREKYAENSLLGQLKSMGQAAAKNGAVYGRGETGVKPAERDTKSDDFVEMPKAIKTYGDNMMNKTARTFSDMNTADLSEHQHRLYQIELERTGNAKEAFAFATDPSNSDVKPYGDAELPAPSANTRWGDIYDKTQPGVEPVSVDPVDKAVRSVGVETGEVVDTDGEVDANGFPVGYLDRTAQVESGGRDDARNPKSSATGRYQFTKKTANALGYSLDDMTDPVKAEEAMVKLTKQHQVAFEKVMGRKPSSDELYMMHQQGQGPAMKVFRGDQDANAVEVLGADAVLNNGGTKDMTVGEYKAYWENRYGQFGEKGSPLQLRPAGAQTSDEAFGQTKAAQPEKADAVARVVSAAEADELSKGQVAPTTAPGQVPGQTKTPGEFKFGNYKQTEGQSLFGSLIAMGLTYLGGRAMGGDPGEALAAGLIAGTHTFGNSLNRNARAQNIEYLLEQGMAPETIDQWILTGDPKALEQKKVAEWKSVGDGSGRLWRVSADGTPEFSNATKQQFVPVVIGGKEYAAYTNEDGSIKRDAEGNPLVSHQTKVASNTSRNIVDVSLNDDKTVKTTIYSDGTKMTEGVSADADAKKKADKEKVDKEEYLSSLRSFDALKGRAATLIGKLEEGGVTGPIDSSLGYVYSKTGVDFMGGKKATEVKKEMSNIINELLPEYKKILGSGITDADMAWMQTVDGLDWTDDEQANIMSLNNILAKMDARIAEAKAQAADKGWNTPTQGTAAPKSNAAPLFKVVG